MSERLAGMTVREIRLLARRDAEEILRIYWPAQQVPVNPTSIARSMGLSVFTAQLGEDTWGMLMGSSTSQADIYLDRDQPEVRMRFSCAHELGHYVDRGDTLDGQAFVDKRSTDGQGTADEIFANEFAAALLMPERAFRAHDGLSEYDVAALFDVSPVSVRWRRRHLSTTPAP